MEDEYVQLLDHNFLMCTSVLNDAFDGSVVIVSCRCMVCDP